MPATLTYGVPTPEAVALLNHCTNIIENISQLNEYETGKTWTRNDLGYFRRIYAALFPNDSFRVTVDVSQRSRTIDICAYDESLPVGRAIVSQHLLKYSTPDKLEIVDYSSSFRDGPGRLTVPDLIHITRSLSILVQK